MPFFSFIIPVYNSEKYLSRCLDSILNQNMTNIEVITVNDGSTDSSLDILKTYALKYPKIIKIINQKNKGIGPARNEGFKTATGKFIWFIDNDDWILKNCLAEIKTILDQNKPDILNINYLHTNNYIDFLDEKSTLTQISPKEAIVFGVDAPWSKIYSHVFLSKADLIFAPYFGEDTSITFKLYAKAKKIISTSKTFYFWFINEDSFSTNIHTKFHLESFFKTLKILLKQSTENPLLKDELEYIFYKKSILLLDMLNTSPKYDQSLFAIAEKIKEQLLPLIHKYETNFYVKFEKKYINEITRLSEENKLLEKEINLSKVKTKDKIKHYIKNFLKKWK